MKKTIFAIVLLLAASSNAVVSYGPGVFTLSKVITSADGYVSANALPHYKSSCGCELSSCGCGC